MPLLLVLVIAVPLLGAVMTFGLSLVARLRSYVRYITVAVSGFTTVLILGLRWIEPIVAVPSLWQPSLLFGSVLTLDTDVTVQPLALALALVTFSATLVDLDRTDSLHPQLGAAVLALVPAGVVALWSANVLTMMIGWAIYDFLQAATYIAAGGSTRAAVRAIVLSSLATLLFWTGAVLEGGGADVEMWSLMTINGTSLTLWIVAGMIRLWVYPFHLSAPDDLVEVPPLGILLLLSPILGWGLWLRIIAVADSSVLDPAGVSTLAAGTLALGGLLAWSCESPRRLLPWIGMAANGAIMLSTGLDKEIGPVVVVAGGVAWALGIAVFFLGDGWRQKSLWWNVPTLVGLLTLLGAPFTLGFVTTASLFDRLAQGGRIAWGDSALWGIILGYLFLLPSLVRRLLVPPSSPLPHQRVYLVARGVGLGMLALLLVGVGLFPSILLPGDVVGDAGFTLGRQMAMPRLEGWLLWVIILACGGVLAWQERVLRAKIGLMLSAAHDVLRLEWLYESVVGALNRGLSVLRVADEVVGGAGALLWSLVLFLLIVLVWSGS
jgi:formate hydrogenlyase subunit 3/multisubunit Na+/H+ antiporter MnhD subunit